MEHTCPPFNCAKTARHWNIHWIVAPQRQTYSVNVISNMDDSPNSPPAAMAERPPRPFTLLRQREFRSLWLMGTVNASTRWMEILAVSIWVYEVTGSPLAVAMILFARMLPMILFGAALSVVVERFDKRKVQMGGFFLVALISLILAMLAWLEQLAVWHAGVGAFLVGIFFACDNPVRRNLIGETAGPNGVATAMALESVTLNGTRLIGPLVGGAFMEYSGVHGAYLVTAVLCAFAVVLAYRLAPRPVQVHVTGAPAALNFLDSLQEGLVYARARPAIMGLLAVTALANTFGFPFTSMIPVIGKEQLDLGPGMVGVLSSAFGIGSLATSLWFTVRPPRHVGSMYIRGALYMMVPLIVFAWSPWFALSFALLLMAGVGQAAFSTSQGAVVFALTDARMRGRTMGLVATCIGTMPAGVLFMGVIAAVASAAWAVGISAVIGTGGLIWIFLRLPQLRKHP